MTGERGSFQDDDGVNREPWTTLRAMISDFEPDQALIRQRMNSTPSVIDIAPRRRQAAGRRRLPIVAAAASVLIVAGSVVLAAHAGLGRGGSEGSPAGVVGSSPSPTTSTLSTPSPTTLRTPSTGQTRSGPPSPADAGRTTRAEHTVLGKAGRPSARVSTPPSIALTSVGVIRGAQSGKCVTVPGAAKANGTVTVLATCGTSPDQTWTLTPSHELTVYGGTKCLDVAGQNISDGAAVQVWDCNGGSNQLWTVNSDGTIVGVQSGRCLDATGQALGDGTPLQTWTCNGGANQKWSRS